MSKITLENFSEQNRTRRIGESQYRICRTKEGKWYVLETYNHLSHGISVDWERATGFYSYSLSEVIEVINSFRNEKEVINHCTGRFSVQVGANKEQET